MARQRAYATKAELERWRGLDPLFVDTETTGLDEIDQVIEIAVLDAGGATLYHSLVRPTVPVSDSAAAVHGITTCELASAPTWPEIYQDVRQLLKRRTIVGHNARFDALVIKQTCAAYGLEPFSYNRKCTMALLSDHNGGNWPSLSLAADLAGVELPTGAAHRAAYDAECVRRIVMEGFK